MKGRLYSDPLNYYIEEYPEITDFSGARLAIRLQKSLPGLDGSWYFNHFRFESITTWLNSYTNCLQSYWEDNINSRRIKGT